MSERLQQCQAPKHESKCPCVTCNRQNCNGCRNATIDHFQPKCIAKAWDLKANRDGNLQPLSRVCHDTKDRDTALRAQVLKYQLGGGKLTFEQHQQIFKDRSFKK